MVDEESNFSTTEARSVCAGWSSWGLVSVLRIWRFGFLEAGYRDFVLMEEIGKFILGGEEAIAVEL